MGRVRWYPDWVFNINEDITRRNMAEYDRKRDKVPAKCREINPDYDNLPSREKYKIYKAAWDAVEKEV